MLDQIYQYIVQYKSQHNGNSPSHRQIAQAVGLNSPSNVNYYLTKLHKQGKITLPSNTTKHIIVTGSKWTLTDN